jgi:hypothetical protein
LAVGLGEMSKKTPQQVKELELATLAFAQYLGVDIDHEPELLSIAKEALTDLPSPWEVCVSNENDEDIYIPFFYNNETQESLWNHPFESIYLQKIKEERKYSKNSFKGNKSNNEKSSRYDDSRPEKSNRSEDSRSVENKDKEKKNKFLLPDESERRPQTADDLVEVEEFELIDSDDDKGRPPQHQHHQQDDRDRFNKDRGGGGAGGRGGGYQNGSPTEREAPGDSRRSGSKDSRRDKREEEGVRRGSRPTSPIFGNDWLDSSPKKSIPGLGEERGGGRGQDKGRGGGGEEDEDWGRARGGGRDEWDDGTSSRNKERGGSEGRGRGQEREKEKGRGGGGSDWRDEDERGQTNWERERDLKEKEREREREREQRERDREREKEKERERERERETRDTRDRGQWLGHPTVDTNLASLQQQQYSQLAPLSEPMAIHQQALSPPLSLPLYQTSFSPYPAPAMNGIAAFEKERESATLAMSRFQSEISRLQDELVRERERHRGEVREMELVIASLKTSLQVSQ